jgi:chaperone required for assembly of F1-ATPase
MIKKMYESAILINAALEDNQIQSIISHIKELISSNDGEITLMPIHRLFLSWKNFINSMKIYSGILTSSLQIMRWNKLKKIKNNL